MTVIGICFASFFISFLGIFLLRRFLLAKSVLDYPNDRSAHKAPVPLMGGIGVIVAVYTVILVWARLDGNIANITAIVMLLSFVIACLGMVDDCVHLSAGIRFGSQIVLATCFVIFGTAFVGISFPFYSVPLVGLVGSVVSVFFIVSMTNIYNFMDGIDGYAGGIGVLGASWLSYCFFSEGERDVAILLVSLIAALLGFLVWNYPKAKIFMGDVGSTFLGFFFAVMIVILVQINPLYLMPSLMVFGVFIGDATVTLIRRLLNKERFWEPHRSHYYQRLHQSGWSHTRVIWLEYLHTGINGYLAYHYLLATHTSQLVLLFIFMIIFFIKFVWIEYQKH